MDYDDNSISEKNIFIVKGRFKSPENNIYGLLLIVLNPDRGYESINAIVSTYSEIFNNEPHTPWNKIEEIITNLKWKGTYNVNMTGSIIDQLKTISDDKSTGQLLYDNVYNYDYDNLEITLFDIVNRIVHDKKLVLETGIQEINLEEYQNTIAGKNESAVEEQGTPDEGEEKSSDDSVILIVKPILAPVKGKPLFDLKVGDRVMIKIDPVSERANSFIDILGLRDYDQILPAPARVVDIKGGSGKNAPSEILTEIQPGIYGKFYEEESQVKLRMFDPAVDRTVSGAVAGGKKGKKVQRPVESYNEPAFSRGTLIMLIMFLIIMALFAFILFINW